MLMISGCTTTYPPEGKPVTIYEVRPHVYLYHNEEHYLIPLSPIPQ